MSAKRHDGIVHRAAREGRGGRACSRGAPVASTNAAPRAASPVLAQAAALLPSERAATTRSLDESAGDNWLRCFRSTPVFHITTRQRDLLDGARALLRGERGASRSSCPPKTKSRRAAALEPYRATLEAPPDAGAPAQARREGPLRLPLCGGAGGPCRRDRRACGRIQVRPHGPGLPLVAAALAVQAPSKPAAALARPGRRPGDADGRARRLRAAGRGAGNKPETLALLCRTRSANCGRRPSERREAALQAAAFSGFADVARVLIAAGADPAYADDEGLDRLDLARRRRTC